MGSLLSAQRSSQYPRQAQHGSGATSEAVGSVVFADQLTCDAKHSGLQTEKADVLPGELFFHLSDFLPRVSLGGVNGENYMGRPEFRSDRAGSALWINMIFTSFVCLCVLCGFSICTSLTTKDTKAHKGRSTYGTSGAQGNQRIFSWPVLRLIPISGQRWALFRRRDSRCDPRHPPMLLGTPTSAG